MPEQGDTWHIELLGGLRARSSTLLLERMQTHKTAALLAYLSLHMQRQHSREELAELIWPESSSDSGRASLSQALSWLRRRLDGDHKRSQSAIVSDRYYIRLNPKAVTTDVARFETLVVASEREPVPARRRGLLGEAVAHYKGSLLPGFYEDWAVAERERLEFAYLRVLEQLTELHESLGDLDSALTTGRIALAADPLSESAHGSVIRLLALKGDRLGAVRQFRALERMLRDEYDEEPNTATRALVNRLAGAAPDAGPERAARETLPTWMTRFFGREDELSAIHRMVRDDAVRLITITGIGGCGKTRLAAQAASLLRGDLGLVAWYVSLRGVVESGHLLSALCEALQITAESAGAADNVTSALSKEPAVIVLDNLDHLSADAAREIVVLVERVADLVVIATSRSRLRVDGEHELVLHPLPLPESDGRPDAETLCAFPSVQLFLDRAKAARSGFRVTSENAASLKRLIKRLDGIPLAIELCAARAHALSLEQMIARLDNRFELLVSKRIDIPAHHRTLLAVLEDSYLQMPRSLQVCFCTLSVFRGGWTIEAAQCLLGASDQQEAPTLDTLSAIAERSLVVAQDMGIEMRYHMLETVREFAALQLTYSDACRLRDLHLGYFGDFAESYGAEFGRAEQPSRLLRFDAEHDNLRTALQWAQESGQIESGLRLCVAMTQYWCSRGLLGLGRDQILGFLNHGGRTSVGDVADEVRASSLAALGWLTWYLGDYAGARDLHEQALGLFRVIGNPLKIADTLYLLGISAYRQADYENATISFRESIALCRQAGDDYGTARALLNQGNIAQATGDLDESQRLWEESLAIRQRIGDRQGAADVLNNLGVVALERKQHAQAIRLFEEAHARYAELTNDFGCAVSLVNLCSARRRSGDLGSAAAALASGYTTAYAAGSRHLLADYLLQFGHIALGRGDGWKAVFYISLAVGLAEQLTAALEPTDAAEVSDAVAMAHEMLSDELFADAWAAGVTADANDILRNLRDIYSAAIQPF